MTAPEPEFDDDDLEPRPLRWPSRRRTLTLLAVFAVLVALAVLPPLIKMNRYRDRVTSSIGASLGRPVHVGSVTLVLLPLPGLNIENFVVSEDPAFGYEPVIRADSVQVRLRVSSLWRRRVEFSRISFEQPSVNLVHRADGKWNLESILLSASRVAAAPTAQKGAGDAPRFPYIEATGARVNLKMGVDKMPFSLTEAKFSLWLPEAQQWHLRLEAHPTRTDSAAMDTGLLRVEGTLGKAATLLEVPLDLSAQWTAAPLGAVSWVLLGRDAGVRGEMSLTAAVKGTVGAGGVQSHLTLANVRRTDFVPERTLEADIECTAQTVAAFHTLHSVHCAWPAGQQNTGLTLDADVPDVFKPATATGSVAVQTVPLAALLDALRAASPRVAAQLRAGGTVSGRMECCALPAGTLAIEDASLQLDDTPPFVDTSVSSVLGDFTHGGLVFKPVPLNLGSTPESGSLEITVDHNGYSLHLAGTGLRSRLLALAAALPQFGDGLEAALPPAVEAPTEAPMRLDLVSTRPWAGGQTWTAPAHTPPARRHRH